jgi:hypothetical protein
MPYELNKHHLAVAFSSGALIDAGKRVVFEVRELGRLSVSSGAIAASDPLVNPNPRAYGENVPNGHHRVSVAIARFENGDERIAFARVSFTTAAPATWRMAAQEGQDHANLGPDVYFGYGVDSGTGCFMDPVAGKLLAERMHVEDEYCRTIIDGMEQTYKHTRSWFEFRPSAKRDENVICFSSGFGDGSYPSFFGFDVQGRLSVLVTDFLVLEGE